MFFRKALKRVWYMMPQSANKARITANCRCRTNRRRAKAEGATDPAAPSIKLRVERIVARNGRSWRAEAGVM
jgi:hypothetical protein